MNGSHIALWLWEILIGLALLPVVLNEFDEDVGLAGGHAFANQAQIAARG